VLAAYQRVDVDRSESGLELRVQDLAIAIVRLILIAKRELVQVGENLKSRWSTLCVAAKKTVATAKTTRCSVDDTMLYIFTSCSSTDTVAAHIAANNIRPSSVK